MSDIPPQQAMPNNVSLAIDRIRDDRGERAALLQQIKDNTAKVIDSGLGYFIDKIENDSRYIDLQSIPLRVFRNAQTPLTYQNEIDFEIIIKHCFGRNFERSTFLFTDGYSIFGRPIKQSDFSRKIFSKAATAHMYLDQQRHYYTYNDPEFIKLMTASSNVVSDAGLSRKMASQTIDGITHDNLNTVFDLFSELIYYTSSEEEAWFILESLTQTPSTVRFNSLQFISTLPNGLLATMSHAGIVFKMLDSENGYSPTKSLMQLINLTTAGGCPFRNEPNFNRIVNMFISTMKKVADSD